MLATIPLAAQSRPLHRHSFAGSAVSSGDSFARVPDGGGSGTPHAIPEGNSAAVTVTMQAAAGIPAASPWTLALLMVMLATVAVARLR